MLADFFWFVKYICAKSERGPILDQVVFYNFFDQVLDGKRLSPDTGPVAARSARDKFIWMLHKYEPELCIVNSFRAGDALLEASPYRDFRSAISSGGFHLAFGGRNTHLLCLPHPSCPSLWKTSAIWPSIKAAALRATAN